MLVTAKVKLQSKIPYGVGGEAAQVQLEFVPDYGQGRNKEWALNTPSLNLKMNVVDRVAVHFKVGGCYTLTFSEDDE